MSFPSASFTPGPADSPGAPPDPKAERLKDDLVAAGLVVALLLVVYYVFRGRASGFAAGFAAGAAVRGDGVPDIPGSGCDYTRSTDFGCFCAGCAGAGQRDLKSSDWLTCRSACTDAGGPDSFA